MKLARQLAFAALSAIALAAPVAASDSPALFETVPCEAATRFDSPASLDAWPVVLDGIMGGRSSGNRFFKAASDAEGHMVFQGVINTNGGGFSSVRSRIAPGSFGDADGIRFHVRQDGRSYLLMAHNAQDYRGRRISFGGALPNPAPGEWVEVVVPFDTFTGDVSGRPVPTPAFDANSAYEFGIEIADGIDGPFRLEVRGLDCVRRLDQAAR